MFPCSIGISLMLSIEEIIVQKWANLSIGEWVGQRSLLSEFERSHCIKDAVFCASNVIKSRFVISTEIPYDHIMYVYSNYSWRPTLHGQCWRLLLRWNIFETRVLFIWTRNPTAMQLKIFFCEGIINNKNTKPNPENTAVKVGHKITSNLSHG